MFVTLNDGSKLEFAQGTSVAEIAQAISEGLYRNAICGKVNGELVDLSHKVKNDAKVEIMTLKDKEGLDVYRHTCAHVLAQAVKSIFPTCRLAI